MRKTVVMGLLLLFIAASATWFLMTPQPRRVLKASREADRAFVRFLPGGRWALTARVEKKEDPFGRITVLREAPIRLFDLREGREIEELVSKGRTWSYGAANLSPDGKLLAVSIQDGFPSSPLHIWDLESRKRLAELPRLSQTIQEPDREICRISPDGRFVAYVGADPQPGPSENWRLRLWSRDDGRDLELDAYAGPLSRVAFSPDSKRVAVESSIFNTSDGRELTRLSGESSPQNIRTVAWTPDGKKLIIGAPVAQSQAKERTEGTEVTSWDLATGESRLLLTAASIRDLDTAYVSFDGRHLSLRDRLLGEAQIWAMDVDPPELVGYSRAEEFRPTAEKPFSIVGETPVTQRLWRVGTPLERAPVMVKSEVVIHSIEFNSDRSLVSIGHFGNAKRHILDIWDTETSRRMSRLRLDGPFGGFGEQGTTFFEFPPYATTPGDPVELGNPQMRSVKEWDVLRAPPWKWLVSAWFLEAALIGCTLAWLARR